MGGNTDLIEEWKDIILSGRKRDQLQAELGKRLCTPNSGRKCICPPARMESYRIEMVLT